MSDDLRELAAETVREWLPDLLELSHDIHARPELGFQEHYAAERVADMLGRAGFEVERGVGGLPTASRSCHGRGQLHIAFCAEYDALEGIGHACGHNLIAATSIGAAIAFARVAEHVDARSILMGTPAEETLGGKIRMLEAGCFDGLHAAMMIHPGPEEIAVAAPRAVSHLLVRYFGRASHAGTFPELGVNAADAFTIAQVGIGLLRQHLPDQVQVHGVVTRGGGAPNVVPDATEGRWYVRAASLEALESAEQRVRACFEAGALATGADLEISLESPRYSEFHNHEGLLDCYRSNVAALERSASDHPRGQARAATDMANLSRVLPAIHPYMRIDCGDSVNHQPEFADHCVSESADRAIADGAVALAWTAIDAARTPELRRELLEHPNAAQLSPGTPNDGLSAGSRARPT